jgi:transcriptional regulator with XRE-family HTH domain
MSTKKADLDANSFCGLIRAMSPEQCRAARAWLEWSQQDLADRAKVGLSTIKSFEGGVRTPIANNLTAISGVLEGAGVAFLADAKGRPQGITVSKKVAK